MDNEEKNNLVYEIAKRAKELSNMKMDVLRLAAGFNCSTEGQARTAGKYKTRGQLIEEILTEEFVLDLIM